MHKNAVFRIFLLIASVAFLHSCKKEISQDQISAGIGIPSGDKQTMFFKSGTYWIYQDSATLAIDSVYITGWSDEWVSNSNGSYEIAGCEFESSYFTNRDWVQTIDMNRTNIQSPSFPHNHYPEFEFICHMGTFPGTNVMAGVYAPFAANVDTNAYSSCRYTDYYSNVFIRDTLYHGVMRLDMSTTAFYAPAGIYYFAKGKGIIRKEIPANNQVWNLIRCNIVQ